MPNYEFHFRSREGESFIVELDRAVEGVQEIRQRGLHAVPVGNHLGAQGITEIITRGAANAAHESSHRQLFLVTVVSQTH